MDRAGASNPREKLLAAPRVKLRLAIASAVIIGTGALLAPRAAPTALSTPQEHAAPLLEEQVQLREVPRPFRGVQEIALRVREHTVAIPPLDRRVSPTVTDFSEPRGGSSPVGFGVFVSDTHLLTHAAALEGRSSAPLSTPDGKTFDARVSAYEPDTGLVLLQTSAAVGRPAAIAASPPEPGTFAVAVGRWDGRDIAVPVFVTGVGGDRYRIGAVGADVLPGMPIYTLDNELLALAAGRGEDIAFPARESANRLIARTARGERQASIGVAFQDLAGALTGVFGEKGVVINHVLEGSPADDAGVQAGDVLVAIADTAIDSAGTAARALRSMTPGNAATLRILRGRRARNLEVTPALAYEVAATARTDSDDRAPGPEARVLFPKPVLDSARIPDTARVLSVDGRPLSSRAQAHRVLRGARQPIPVLVQLDGTRFFAVIEPPR